MADSIDTKTLTLKAMPGMIGAIDKTFRDQVGKTVAFVLVAFVDGTAVHATNISPAVDAMASLAALVEALKVESGTLQ